MNINPFEKPSPEDSQEQDSSETNEEQKIEKGVGKRQEQYIAKDESAAKNLSSLRDSLDDSSVARLEEMKKRKENTEESPE